MRQNLPNEASLPGGKLPPNFRQTSAGPGSNFHPLTPKTSTKLPLSRPETSTVFCLVLQWFLYQQPTMQIYILSVCSSFNPNKLCSRKHRNYIYIYQQPTMQIYILKLWQSKRIVFQRTQKLHLHLSTTDNANMHSEILDVCLIFIQSKQIVFQKTQNYIYIYINNRQCKYTF